METFGIIEVTNEEIQAAAVQLANAPHFSVEKTILEYTAELDRLCEQFGIVDHHELMLKADEGALPSQISTRIRSQYSFLSRTSQRLSIN